MTVSPNARNWLNAISAAEGTTRGGKESLLTYLKNLEDGGYMAKDIYELSEKVGAPDVSNALADVVKHMFKGAWMLKSTLR